MAFNRKRRTRFVKRRIRKGFCPLCKESVKDVDYKDVPLLQRFVTDRGKIMDRADSHLCAKHQRRIANEIKKARIAALLPFVQ